MGSILNVAFQLTSQLFRGLSLGYYKDKRLGFAGGIGTGFNDKSSKEIFHKFKPLETSRLESSHSRWVKPYLSPKPKLVNGPQT